MCSHLLLKMEEYKQLLWHIMLYCFKKGKNATGLQKKICAVYGEAAVTEVVYEVSCRRFLLLNNAPRLGGPVEVDSNQIKTLIENNQCYATQEIADIFKIPKSSIENHLHQVGYVHRFDVWVPHK